MGSQSLLQGNFLTQGLNWGLQNCRQNLCCQSHHGSHQGKRIWKKIYIYKITVLHFKKRMRLGFWLSGKWGWPQYQWTMESWDSLDTMTSKLPKLIKNEQSCLNNVVVCNTAPTEGKTLSAPQLLIWPSWYYQWLFTRVMGCDDYLRLMPVSDSLQKEIQELRALNYQPNAWLQNCVRTLRIPYLW